MSLFGNKKIPAKNDEQNESSIITLLRKYN